MAAPQSTPVAAQPPAAAITLDDAIARARANEPVFAAAVAASRNAALDQSIARAAMLPNAVYNNQFIYTQGGSGLILDPAKLNVTRSNAAPRCPALSPTMRFMNTSVRLR